MNEPAIDAARLEGLCAAALDALPRTIVVSNDETILFANATAAHAWGAASAAELIGLPINDMLHPDSHAAAAERRRLLATSRRELLGLPTKLLRRDGTTINAIADAHPIEHQGRPAFVFLSRRATPEERAS